MRKNTKLVVSLPALGLTLLLFWILYPGSVQADTHNWTYTGSLGYWKIPANWSMGLPSPGDDVNLFTVSGSFDQTVIYDPQSTFITLGDLIIEGNSDHSMTLRQRGWYGFSPSYFFYNLTAYSEIVGLSNDGEHRHDLGTNSVDYLVSIQKG